MTRFSWHPLKRIWYTFSTYSTVQAPRKANLVISSLSTVIIWLYSAHTQASLFTLFSCAKAVASLRVCEGEGGSLGHVASAVSVGGNICVIPPASSTHRCVGVHIAPLTKDDGKSVHNKRFFFLFFFLFLFYCPIWDTLKYFVSFLSFFFLFFYFFIFWFCLLKGSSWKCEMRK